MYSSVGIQQLSPTQISRILNGHSVRVKHGNAHNLKVTHEHHKKIMSAHRRGAGVNIALDPYAIQHNQHLRGHKKHYGMGEGMGEGIHHLHTLSRHPHHRHHKRHGMGILTDVGSLASDVGHALYPIAKDIGVSYAKKRLGLGEGLMRQRKKRASRGGALMPSGYGEGKRRVGKRGKGAVGHELGLSLIHISEPTRPY